MGLAEPGGDIGRDPGETGGPGGYSGGGPIAGPPGFGFEADPRSFERAREFERALGRYGLSPNDLMSMALESRTLSEYQDRVSEVISGLSGMGLLGEFGRGLLGRTTLRDLTGYYSPVEKAAMGAVTKGLTAFGGLPGAALAGLARGAAAIGTGKSSDFGGGFGQGDQTAGGLGGETPEQSVAAALGGQELGQAIAGVREQIQTLMRQYRMQDVFAEHQNLSEEVAQMRALLEGGAA